MKRDEFRPDRPLQFALALTLVGLMPGLSAQLTDPAALASWVALDAPTGYELES